ncbi:energy-coupling factor transporter transmembrane protein EcfT [Paenibacillus oenotherae]|uniref:Energy-coupling factor transporter transmembrane protein EcfT n=1 Tax=Paenibacillus oenotherae TaxID=1435645 RepID=A0ABS7D7P4_9BACL|nr:energy-coupling factor transporter transmembrane component T [Paenibacillus oenotherae]MBW7475798.1 energy-coupling factor transporter transmembrane protein EcfT [Paenibacillus oenotherae]
MELAEPARKSSIWEKLSVERIKIELLRTAYGQSRTFLSRFDPRMLIGWYSFFAIAPWFIHNKTVLIGMLLAIAVLTYTSKPSVLVFIVLAFGLVTDTAYMLIVALAFGGGLPAALALSTLTLKLLVIALASIAVFSSMDPEKLSDALLSLGMPAQFSFGVAYGYRMLPILIEEYNNLLYSYRLRGRTPLRKGLLGWRSLVYMGKISILAFYPLILNTAKRTRTTVEALEVKGFTYAVKDPKVKRIKLAYLKILPRDYAFLAISAIYVAFLFWLGNQYTL